MKKIQDCKVYRINNLNEDTYILELNLPIIPEEIKPGNFAEIRIDKTADVFLRRPFSIFNVDYKKKRLQFFIKNTGKGTKLINQLNKGENVNIIYPLGNSFAKKCYGKSLLVGGGTGLAPFLLLSKLLKKFKSEMIYLFGAKSAKDIHLVKIFEKYGQVFITTEDGSLGEKGLVTSHSIWKRISEFDKIYACGPNSMMKAIAKIAKSQKIDCEVSLENMMACGFGTCLCCVTDTIEGNKCVCTDGPVFNTNYLKW